MYGDKHHMSRKGTDIRRLILFIVLGLFASIYGLNRLRNGGSMTILERMRTQLRPYWIPVESGGIAFIADLDEEKNNEVFARVFPDFSEMDPSSKATRDICTTIETFFRTAVLPPGEYHLENYHRLYAHGNTIQFDSNGNPPIDIPEGKSFVFTVTEDHIRLIRHISFGCWRGIRDGVIELMDYKRPYGDMTYYDIDMADALGETIPNDEQRNSIESDDQHSRYLRLHGQMLFAVQAFWQYAVLP